MQCLINYSLHFCLSALSVWILSMHSSVCVRARVFLSLVSDRIISRSMAVPSNAVLPQRIQPVDSSPTQDEQRYNVRVGLQLIYSYSNLKLHVPSSLKGTYKLMQLSNQQHSVQNCADTGQEHWLMFISNIRIKKISYLCDFNHAMVIWLV